jgi:hypothetical protein
MACCPPLPAQVFAQNLPKQHGIIYLLFNFQVLKIKMIKNLRFHGFHGA